MFLRDAVAVRAAGAVRDEVPQREPHVAHLLPGGRAQGESMAQGSQGQRSDLQVTIKMGKVDIEFSDHLNH